MYYVDLSSVMPVGSKLGENSDSDLAPAWAKWRLGW